MGGVVPVVGVAVSVGRCGVFRFTDAGEVAGERFEVVDAVRVGDGDAESVLRLFLGFVPGFGVRLGVCEGWWLFGLVAVFVLVGFG